MLDKIIEIIQRDLDALRAVTNPSPGIRAEIRALETVLRSISAIDKDKDEGNGPPKHKFSDSSNGARG